MSIAVMRKTKIILLKGYQSVSSVIEGMYNFLLMYPLQELDPLGPELLDTSGDGTADKDNWTGESAAVLTNPNTGILKITRNGSNNPRGSQTVVTIGKRYRIMGEARSDGNTEPRVSFSTGVYPWIGTTSTDWQSVDFEAIADDTKVRVWAWTSTGTEYTEWRNLSVNEITSQTNVSLATNREVALGRDVAINGDFEGTYDDESGGGGGTINVAPNWNEKNVIKTGADTLDKETTTIHGGSASQYINVTGANSGIEQSANSMDAGKTYNVGVWVYPVFGLIRLFDSNGVVLDVSSGTGAWEKLSKNNHTPTANALLRIISFSGASEFYVDDASIQQTDIEASSVFPGAELYVTANAASDPAGNEVDSTTGWTAASTTLTSDSAIKSTGSYSLKSVFIGGGGASYFDLDTILTVGERYKINFNSRHLGSGGAASVTLGSVPGALDTLLTTLTSTDTTFVSYPSEFTHSATTRYLSCRENSGTNDGGVYIDNISLTPANPFNGDDVGTLQGVPGNSRILYMKRYDGLAASTDTTGAEHNSVYVPTLFTKTIAFRKSTWDTTERYLFHDYVDANNYIAIRTTTTTGQLAYDYMAGGTLEQVLVLFTVPPTDIQLAGISVKVGVMKAWLGAIQYGGDQAVAGTFEGNFTAQITGAKEDLTSVHLGDLAYENLFDDELSQGEWLILANTMLIGHVPISGFSDGFSEGYGV